AAMILNNLENRGDLQCFAADRLQVLDHRCPTAELENALEIFQHKNFIRALDGRDRLHAVSNLELLQQYANRCQCDF
ncbi:MAG: hypothetical protein JXR89_09200, partial [Deltaproteobacteria bacterium]|nr:hypothetical protein [Deltaproteobacteria bacterium]